jgi:hypothetical protein
LTVQVHNYSFVLEEMKENEATRNKNSIQHIFDDYIIVVGCAVWASPSRLRLGVYFYLTRTSIGFMPTTCQKVWAEPF